MNSSTGFQIEAELPTGKVSVPVPARAFSSLAEQLRWEAFRAGRIGESDWSAVSARVVSVADVDSTHGQIGVQLMLGPRKCAERRYRPREIQNLVLLVQDRSADSPCMSGEDAGTWQLCWQGGNDPGGVPVPLSPLQLPTSACPQGVRLRHPLPPRLIVFDGVTNGLQDLGQESLHREAEIGACLVGHVPDVNTLVITHVVRATGGSASAAEVSFDPRFWLEVAASLKRTGRRVMGWAHSHLCDLGHPRALSRRDLEVLYSHFPAPWSVTSLVCASREEPEVHWFGWRDGAVTSLPVTESCASPVAATGENRCLP